MQKKLNSMGATKEIPFSKEKFCSRIFLVPKKRHVIDLSRLDKFVENFHFKMETISSFKQGRLYDLYRLKGCLSVCPRIQITKVPLLPVEKQNIFFQGLQFGLNTAPRIFTKLIKSIAAYLRKRGIRIIVYLDDFLILGSSIEESNANTW